MTAIKQMSPIDFLVIRRSILVANLVQLGPPQVELINLLK